MAAKALPGEPSAEEVALIPVAARALEELARAGINVDFCAPLAFLRGHGAWVAGPIGELARKTFAKLKVRCRQPILDGPQTIGESEEITTTPGALSEGVTGDSGRAGECDSGGGLGEGAGRQTQGEVSQDWCEGVQVVDGQDTGTSGPIWTTVDPDRWRKEVERVVPTLERHMRGTPLGPRWYRVADQAGKLVKRWGERRRGAVESARAIESWLANDLCAGSPDNSECSFVHDRSRRPPAARTLQPQRSCVANRPCGPPGRLRVIEIGRPARRHLEPSTSFMIGRRPPGHRRLSRRSWSVGRAGAQRSPLCLAALP